MKTFTVLFALSCLLALGACAKSDTETAPAATSNAAPAAAIPDHGSYTVTEIDAVAVNTPQPITATLADERLSGKGPVNNWSLPVEADGKLGIGISTRMAGPEELMQLEDRLLKALDGGTLSAEANGGLTVRKNGKVSVRLQPAATTEAK